MVLTYHTIIFLIAFFASVGAAIVFILPLAVILILNVTRRDGCQATGTASLVVSMVTSLAIVFFTFALMLLSTFGWIPFWGAGIIITGFTILVIVALRPWKKSERGAMLWCMIGLMIFVMCVAWAGTWLTMNICFTSEPQTVNFYVNRYNADACKTTAPKPCHTYITFNTNASTDAIVHFQTSSLYKSPFVMYGTTSGVYTNTVNASSHYMSQLSEITRYVNLGYLRALTPSTTYYFVAGDATDGTNATFTVEKKFRTAPATGPFSFVTGGDMGVSTAAQSLLQYAASTEPTFFAMGGDLAYANSITSCYGRWDDWLDQLETYMVTPMGYTVPMISAPGNHEAGGWQQPISGMNFYNHYFAFENLLGRALPSLPLHHQHFISNLVFLFLDSWVVESPASQVSWITSALANATARGSWSAAIYHAPGYPSFRPLSDVESTAVRTHFVPAFEEGGLTVAFENHDHAWKRTKLLWESQPNATGILYMGDGAMGVTPRTGLSLAGRDYLNTSAPNNFYISAVVEATGVDLTSVDASNATFDSYFMGFR